MSLKRVVSLVTLIVFGCATAPQVPAPLPVAWSQTPAEKGKLTVGEVIAIQRWQVPDLGRESRGSEFATMLIGVFVIVPLVLVVVPTVAAVCALRDDRCKMPEAEKYGVREDKNGNVYRHVVRLVGEPKAVIKDEYWTFTVGDCVALRHKPDMLVPALAGECGSKRSTRMEPAA